MAVGPRFNYIITIHNKEDLIQQVLMAVLMCCRDNSHVYPVLDGCTDKSESIIDELTDTFAHVPITKVHTDDVHELLSINAGLRAADHAGSGYNIVLQDDVILADFLLEQKVQALYQWAGPKLGYLSFRLGANFTADAADSESPIPLTDYIENAYGHGLPDAQSLMPGQLAYRSVPIKSPVCIPFELVRSLGMLEEELAPFAHDDTEYGLRCLQAGYRNAVFALRFYSDVKWGGTRQSPGLHTKIGRIQDRNMRYIRERHAAALAQVVSGSQGIEVVDVPGMTNQAESQRAQLAWEENCAKLHAVDGHVAARGIKRFKSMLQAVGRKAYS